MDIKSVLKVIEKHKNNIAKERDKLRVIYDELDDLLDAFDRGIEGLSDGKREIEEAIDAISEKV